MRDVVNVTEQLSLIPALPAGRTDLGEDAWIHYEPEWLGSLTQSLLARNLMLDAPWKQESKYLWGKHIRQPRLTAWYGMGWTWESGYRDPRDDVQAMPDPLVRIAKRLATITGEEPNACLVNWYRTEQDSVGWHSDDEPHIFPRSPIASLSLLARRPFRWRRKDDHSAVFEVSLGEGDLLVMGGSFQQHFQHEVPKTTAPVGNRLNLTFRTYQEK